MAIDILAASQASTTTTYREAKLAACCFCKSCSFSNSATLRCLKYVTQLLAQFFSNSWDSVPHALLAASLSLMASRMLLRLRHWLNASRESQHFALERRSGATNAPSCAGFDAGDFAASPDDVDQLGSRPIGWKVVSENDLLPRGALISHQHCFDGF